MALVEVRDVHKKFGRVDVLKGVSLDVEEGEIVTIIGRSGSGKSTLLRCIDALETIEGGEIRVEGRPVHAGMKDLRQFRQRVGIVFQAFNLFPHMTVERNITLAPLLTGRVGKAEARALAEEVLARVGLSDKIDAWPEQLSGGQQQRVAIARCLAKNPQILFADEPTSALDGENGQIVIRLLRRAATEHGAAVICVTHDPRLEEWADRVIKIEDGVIISDERRTPNPDATLASH